MQKLEELIVALDGGYWQASVYHCPPPRSRRDNPLKNASTVRLHPRFPTEEAALKYASEIIESGWAGTISVNQETAKPSASFILSKDAVDAIGRFVPTLRSLAQENDNADK